MKRQIFESIPSEERLIIHSDLLKYENAFLKNEIKNLQEKIAELERKNRDYLDKLQLQQKCIDDLTSKY